MTSHLLSLSKLPSHVLHPVPTWKIPVAVTFPAHRKNFIETDAQLPSRLPGHCALSATSGKTVYVVSWAMQCASDPTHGSNSPLAPHARSPCATTAAHSQSTRDRHSSLVFVLQGLMSLFHFPLRSELGTPCLRKSRLNQDGETATSADTVKSQNFPPALITRKTGKMYDARVLVHWTTGSRGH